MKKINLAKAKELLNKQGYEIEADLEETFRELFWVAEDAKQHFLKSYGIFDKTNQTSVSNFILTHRKELEDYCFKEFQNNDTISESYSAIVQRAVENLMNKELSKFKINPLSCETYIKRDAKYAVQSRQNKRCWYVLHYNVHNTWYLNEIEFLTFREAVALFLGSEPLSAEDRIELMFAPKDDDEIFGDNIVVAWKGCKK